MVIGYLNESRDPYLDKFIFTARLSSDVSFVSVRCMFTEIDRPLSFFHVLFYALEMTQSLMYLMIKTPFLATTRKTGVIGL